MEKLTIFSNNIFILAAQRQGANFKELKTYVLADSLNFFENVKEDGRGKVSLAEYSKVFGVIDQNAAVVEVSKIFNTIFVQIFPFDLFSIFNIPFHRHSQVHSKEKPFLKLCPGLFSFFFLI